MSGSPTISSSHTLQSYISRFDALRINDTELPSSPRHLIQSRLKELYKVLEDINISIEGEGIFEHEIIASSHADEVIKKQLIQLSELIEREVAGYEGVLQLMDTAGGLSLANILSDTENEDFENQMDGSISEFESHIGTDIESGSEFGSDSHFEMDMPSRPRRLNSFSESSVTSSVPSSILHSSNRPRSKSRSRSPSPTKPSIVSNLSRRTSTRHLRNSSISSFNSLSSSQSRSALRKRNSFDLPPPSNSISRSQRSRLSTIQSSNASIPSYNLEFTPSSLSELSDDSNPFDVLSWVELRGITGIAFNPLKGYGTPTSLAVDRHICLGTTHGLILVFDHSQTLKAALSTPGYSSSNVPDSITTLTTTSSTLLAGTCYGRIHIFDLQRFELITTIPPYLSSSSNPSSKSKSKQRKPEDHRKEQSHNVSITQLILTSKPDSVKSFVSVTSQGLAFLHQLKKGNVITRGTISIASLLSGSGTSTGSGNTSSYKPKGAVKVETSRLFGSEKNKLNKNGYTCIFDARWLYNLNDDDKCDANSGLRLGGVVAIITPFKMVLIQTKPSVKTLYRVLRVDTPAPDIGSGNVGIASLAYHPLPSSKLPSYRTSSITTACGYLAFSWGSWISIVQLQYRISSSGLTSAKKTGKEGGKSYESGSDSGSSTRSEKKVRLEVTTIGEFNVGEGIMRCWWVDDKWLLLLTQSEQLHAFYAPTMSLIESSDIKDKRIQLQDWFLNVVKRLSPLAPSHSPPPFSSDLSNTSVQSRGVEISSKGGVVKEKIAVRGFSCTETWKEYDNRGSFLVLADDRLYISTLRPYTSRIKSLLVQQEYATALDLCHTLYLAYGPQSRKRSSSYSESLSASDDESAAPGVPILAVTGVPNDNNQFHRDLSELVRDVLVAWLTLIATSNDVLRSYAANGKEDEDQQVKEILRSWVNICSDMNMMDVLFSDVYECLVSSQPLQNWLDLFYGILSSLILPKTSPPLPTPSSPSLPLTLPPNVLQDLLRHIALEGNYSKFEDLILNIPEPELLDLNFVWAICKSHRLWHAATYISAWVVRDWVGTFCELIFALADLMTKNKTNGVTEDASGRQSEEKNVKQLIFDYLFSVFGDKRPPFVNLSSKDSEESKLSLLRFIFSPTYISVSSILSATSSSLQASSHSPSNTTIELTTLPLPYRKSRGTQSINNESEYPYIKFLIYLNPLKFYRVLETAFKNDEIWKAIGQNQPHNIAIPFSPTTNRFPFISPFDQSSSLNLSTSASSVNSTTRITKQWIIDTLISLYPYDELNRNRLDVLRKSDVEEDMLGVEMLALYSFIGKIVVECKDDVVLRDQVLHDIFLMLTSVSVNANDVYDEELDTFLHSERQDAIINLLSLLSLDTTSQSHILELCQSSKLYKVLIWVYTRQRRFDMVIQCYLSDSQLSPVVFNVINGLLGDIELSLDVKKEVRKVVIDEVMKLADIDVKVLANMVKLFMIENVDLIWSKLKETKFKFEFLQAFVEGIENSSSNADVELSTDIASSEDDLSLSMDNERCLIERLDMPVLSELVERYIALLARRQPKSVFPFLLQLKSPIYRSEKVLKIIRECGIVDATAWLLEKQGKVSEALDGVLKVVKERSRFWLQPVESSHTVPAIDVELSENEQTNGEEGAESTKRTVAAEGRKNQLGEPVYKPSAKPALIKINAILKFAIQLCQRNSVADSLETIQLWFKLLDTFLLLQKSIKSAIPILPTKEAPSNQIILLSPIHAFTHFIQTIMESMFGYVSLPPFLSQLIQQQSSAATFGEFRYIILPMLDSYHHEFNLYNTTSRLINADLFKSFHSLYRRLLKPVKVRKQICGICKEILVGSSSVNMNIWNYRQRIDEIDESRTTRKVVVFQCDHGFHKDCMENQLLNGTDEYDEVHKTIGFGVCVLCGPEQIRRLKRKQLAGKQKVPSPKLVKSMEAMIPKPSQIPEPETLISAYLQHDRGNKTSRTPELYTILCRLDPGSYDELYMNSSKPKPLTDFINSFQTTDRKDYKLELKPQASVTQKQLSDEERIKRGVPGLLPMKAENSGWTN